MQVEGLRAILQTWELNANLRAKQAFYMILKGCKGPMCHFEIMQGQKCNLICKICSEITDKGLMCNFLKMQG